MANITTKNGIHIVEVPVKDFRIVMCDKAKKSTGTNCVNAGFFATYHEGGGAFTLPVGHLVCDYDATNKYTKKYCIERGKFTGDKFAFDSSTWSYQNPFHKKSLSTMVIAEDRAYITEQTTLSACDYAISGVPVMRDGKACTFTYAKQQGWDASPLYATWHVFIGLKESDKVIYVLGLKTKTGNLVNSKEAYNKFKTMGFVDVIKLDGGGSFYLSANGKTIQSTTGNRRINSIITFAGTIDKSGNPYPVPTRVLYRFKRGDGVKWLQYELSKNGFACDIDGIFGKDTRTALINYQKSVGLKKDGCCGPLTVAKLTNK